MIQYRLESSNQMLDSILSIKYKTALLLNGEPFYTSNSVGIISSQNF